MNKKKIIGYFIGLLIIILIWEIIANKNAIFPHLSQVFYKISTILVNNLVIASIFTTVFRAICAFLISLFLGIISANLAYKYKIIDYILQPLISILRSIPTISVILIVIILVKMELIPYLIISIIIYPIIHQNILYSLNKIDNELIFINKMDNANSIKNYFMFVLPMSFSGIINAIIQTFGLSVKVQIMSELLIGSTNIKGIGVLMGYYKNFLELDNLFAITFFIIIIVFLIEILLKTILKRLNNLT